MSHIIGSIKEEIESIWIDILPSGRPVKSENVVRIGDCLYVKLGPKRIATSSRQLMKKGSCDGYFFLRNHYNFTEDLLKALVKFKMISKSVMEAHMKDVEELSEKRSRSYDRERITDLAKQYAFKLTPEQKKAMKFHEERKKKKVV